MDSIFRTLGRIRLLLWLAREAGGIVAFLGTVFGLLGLIWLVGSLVDRGARLAFAAMDATRLSALEVLAGMILLGLALRFALLARRAYREGRNERAFYKARANAARSRPGASR